MLAERLRTRFSWGLTVNIYPPEFELRKEILRKKIMAGDFEEEIPDDVIEYVVVHELCHRKEMNHSSAFWTEVEKYCPNYRTHRKWLKDNGGSLIARLP